MNFTEVNGTALRYDLDGNVMETGHYAPIQTPELYARVIGQFLDAVGA